MSETSYNPESKHPRIENAPEGLQLEKFDRIVGLRSDLHAAYYRDKANQTESFDEYVAAAINSRMKRNGIIEGDTEESRKDYEFAREEYEKVADYDRIDWLTTEEGQDMPRRNVVFGELLEHYDKGKTGLIDRDEPQTPKADEDEKKDDDTIEPVIDDPDQPETPVITPEQLEAMDLEALAKAKHEAFAAKLNAPVFGKKRKELMEAYVAAEQAYLTALRAHLEKQVNDQFPNGTGDRAALKEFIEQEVNSRARADEDAQRTALIEKGGARARFLNWYANQSTGKKILVGLGAGVGLGLAGLGLGVAAGAVGGAAGALAGGAMLASRFGRGYAMRMSKIYKKPTNQPGFTIKDDPTEGTDRFYDQSTEFLSKTSREQIKNAETIKKSAIVGAMGAVALGGAIGAGIHMAGIAAEAANDHWPAGYLQHRETWGLRDVNPNAPATPDNTPPPAGDPTPGGNEPPTGEEPPLKPEKPDFRVLGSDERIISRGEGWYETFREMGVSSKDRVELLKEVGPHLHERGLAYWDSNAHEWRMNMTENGKLPKSAIEYIAQKAHENGIHSDYDKFFDATDAVGQDVTTTHEFSSGAQHIGKGEGFYHELGQIGVSPEHQAEVLQQAAPQLYEQGIAYKMNDGLPGINMTPDHLMPQESLETLHQAAIDSNVSDNFTITHEGIVFDELTNEASTTSTVNSEFVVNDFGKSYDADAQSYYNALKGVDRSHWQALLNEAAPKLQSIPYDGKPLTYPSADGWHFREVNQLPPVARKIIASIADKHDWTLVA